MGEYVLIVIDKTSERVTSSWPVYAQPAQQLSGPSRDIVLTPTFAYFATVRYGTNGSTIEPNEHGGAFDFNRLSLADGKLQRFPLPSDCLNPRVVDFAGTPLIYAWNGYGVWKFDTAKGSLEQIVSRLDIEDTLVTDDAGSAATRQAAFADYVMIPGTGVFRLSRLGGLRQLLDANLAYVGGRPSLDLGADGVVVRVFPASLKRQVAVGVLRKKEEGMFFAYVEPRSMKVQSETSLPKGTVPDSIVVLPEGAILYVDRDTASIDEASDAGTKSLWTLARLDAGARPFGSRILLVSNVP